MNKENMSEHVRRILAKKERKKIKEERELYNATKIISSQNNAMRKIIAQKQSASTSFVSKMKDINKSFPHIRTKDDKNYMKENRVKILEKAILHKKAQEEKEELKKKIPFKMKRFEKITSKVAEQLRKNEAKNEAKKEMESSSEVEEAEMDEVEEEEVEEEEEMEEVEEEEEMEEVDEEDEAEEVEEEEEIEEVEEEEVEEEVEEEEEMEEGEEENCKREDGYGKSEQNIIDKFQKNTRFQKNEKGGKDKFHKNYGKLPSYILKKKKDIPDESMDAPPGYRVLKNDERNYVLKELHSQLKQVNEEYKNNKDKEKKIDLGKQLKEIKESIELFSTPYVVVDENF
ncbi:conserved Plasmodium protein, unknown function [Plasmodium vinckei brucechwatti]|uniref:Enkurin domain-containing protein n=1 Tax=Plasmodium vinckei brucechwatti TaxID=119398 RepID=A0A6V7S2M2_PLAVN|nr:conserved Plasmodium protein, unknown function [Plasmodium vinckei brucechwatti]